MTLLNASIEGLHPRWLFLIRWACRLAGCTMKAWKVRHKREKEGK